MKTPRSLTLNDLNPAMLARHDLGGPPTADLARLLGQLDLANSLNDLSINTPYLPGDMILCKLNLVKLKKPRRNPWYRPVLCPCDRRAARANT